MKAVTAALGLAIAMCSGAVLAQDTRLAPDEVRAAFVGKKVVAQTSRGVQVEMRMAPDGTATLGGGFTDSGNWRLNDTGYCAKWQKIRNGNEACLSVVRRGEKTLVLNADGSTNTEIIRIE